MVYLLKFFNIVLMLALTSLTLISCKPTVRMDIDFNKQEAEHYLYFADPGGGIRAYHAGNKTLHVVTEDYDFHPNYKNSGQVLFLRFDRQIEDKENPKVMVMSWDTESGRIQKINELSSFPAAPDAMHQLFFVDQGEKILILHHAKEPLLIDIQLDQKFDAFSLSDYLEDLNYIDHSSGQHFGWLVQYPYQNIFKNKQDLVAPPSQSAIFSLNNNFQWVIWDNIPGEKMFEEFFNGFAYDNFHQLLFVCKDKTLYYLENPGMEKISVAPGIHPFIYQPASLSNASMRRFPWLTATTLLQVDETSIIGTSHFLSLVNHEQQSYTPLTMDETMIMSKNSFDPAHLFDRIIFVGKLKSLPSSYLLVSMKKVEPGHRLSTIQRDQADIIAIFSVNDGQWQNQWSTSSHFYSEVWMEDLSNDGSPEIIHHYCASSFPCSEEIMLNSRSLVWINVYSMNENHQYERASESFPEVYRELWDRLYMVEEELGAYRRERIPFLCDEDVRLLNELMEQSQRIALGKLEE